ncbi:MAG: dienelactone hydrolase family protein [SAR324 cluster bacterium]|nr:dienelactone hydrolase family protein [SAR324 cluster bacterium]
MSDKIESQMTRVKSEDGFVFDAFKASPSGSSKGGLVILQEIFGMTDQLKSLALFYAEKGYETIVPALFDRDTPKTVVPFDDPDRGRAMALALDPQKVLLDVDAAAKEVGSEMGASLIGFCWGGGHAMRLACSLDLKCSVAFYGTALEMHLKNNPQGPKCPMLFHFGSSDDYTPAKVINAVREAIPSAEIEIYEAGHAFANDARATYVESAAVPATQKTLEFLEKYHGA